jgi:threonine/homoserine/homoserine lactone efflux protein
VIARLLAVYAVYLVAAMSPGPAVLYVMRASVGSRGLGRRAALGVSTATTIWVLVAALGLSTVLKGSPRLMDAIRLLGGLYFLRLCWVLARSAASPAAERAPAFVPKSPRAAYVQGVATNATNPGTALFFTGLMGLYDVPAMPRPAQLAVYLGIPVLSLSWYSGLSFAFSDERMSRAYLKLRRPLDGGLAALFLLLGLKLIASVWR